MAVVQVLSMLYKDSLFRAMDTTADVVVELFLLVLQETLQQEQVKDILEDILRELLALAMEQTVILAEVAGT